MILIKIYKLILFKINKVLYIKIFVIYNKK